MTLSRQSVEILLDLIEIKINALQIQDRDDARELNKLRKCRQELLSEQNQIRAQRKQEFINPATLQEKSFRNTSPSRY